MPRSSSCPLLNTIASALARGVNLSEKNDFRRMGALKPAVRLILRRKPGMQACTGGWIRRKAMLQKRYCYGSPIPCVLYLVYRYGRPDDGTGGSANGTGATDRNAAHNRWEAGVGHLAAG